MDFNQVNYDGDLDDLDEEELRSTVEDFEKAQDANVAEFQDAQETMQEMLGDDADFEAMFGEVTDFASAKDELIGEVVACDSFEDSPVSEADLEAASFNKVREYHVYFANLDAEEADEDDDKGEFSDMGNRSPTHTDTDDDEQFAKKHLRGMPGFNPEQ